MQVILAPTHALALKRVAEHGKPILTVEAEYGSEVIEGVVTLAHHTGEWKKFPAPCNNPKACGAAAWGSGYCLISHIDLDTVGGLFKASLPLETEDTDEILAFWKKAESIDLNGPHTLTPDDPHFFLFHAVWGRIQEAQKSLSRDVQDVSHLISGLFLVLDRIESVLLGGEDSALIQEGVEHWEAEKALNKESFVRVQYGVMLRHSEKWVNALYSDPSTNELVESVVGWNPKTGSITLTFRDPKQIGIHAGELMQKLFGSLAGGHAGAAGSPRGQFMTEQDAERVFSVVVQLVKGSD